MTGARIELTGQEAALSALSAIVARAEHPRPMFENIGMSLVTSTQRRFEQSQAPDGSPWPPSLRVLAHGGKTLEKTLRLFHSLIFNASDAGVEVGTNVVYAAIHQFGGTIQIAARQQTLHFKIDKRTGELGNKFVKKSKSTFDQDVAIPAHAITMPARPFLGLDDHDEVEILKIAEEFIGGAEAGK